MKLNKKFFKRIYFGSTSPFAQFCFIPLPHAGVDPRTLPNKHPAHWSPPEISFLGNPICNYTSNLSL